MSQMHDRGEYNQAENKRRWDIEFAKAEYVPKNPYPAMDHEKMYEHMQAITHAIDTFEKIARDHDAHAPGDIQHLKGELKNHGIDRPKLTHGADPVTRRQQRLDLNTHLEDVRKYDWLAYNPHWDKLYNYYEQGMEIAGSKYTNPDDLANVKSKIKFRQHVHLFRDVKSIVHFFGAEKRSNILLMESGSDAHRWIVNHVREIEFLKLESEHIKPLISLYETEQVRLKTRRKQKKLEKAIKNGRGKGGRGGRGRRGGEGSANNNVSKPQTHPDGKKVDASCLRGARYVF
jgi:hypothetical protein